MEKREEVKGIGHYVRSYSGVGAMAVAAATLFFTAGSRDQRVTSELELNERVRALLVKENEADHEEFREAIKLLTKIAGENREMIATNQQDIAKIKGKMESVSK